MKKIIALVGATLLAANAQAADVGVSIQVGQPGFYGRIDIGNASPPPVMLAEPIWVQRTTVRPALRLEHQPLRHAGRRLH